ncbi:MAG: hypothetical protein U0R49_06100 [Fimbriimonadales bacterium]
MKQLAAILAFLFAFAFALAQGQGGPTNPPKPGSPGSAGGNDGGKPKPGQGGGQGGNDGGGKPKPSNPPNPGNGGGGGQGGNDGGGKPKPSNPPNPGNGGGGGQNPKPSNPPAPQPQPKNPPYNGGNSGGNGGSYQGGGAPKSGSTGTGGRSSDSERYSDRGAGYLNKKPSQEDYFKRQNRTEIGPIFAPKTGGNNTKNNSNARNLISRPMNPVAPPVLNVRPIGPPNSNIKYEIAPKDKFRIFRDDNRNRGGGGGGGGGGGRNDYRDGYRDGFYDGYRFGYFHYDPYWRDCHFGYRWWSFDPWSYDCYYSPYYYYWSLPPYMRYDRCHWNPWRIIIVLGGDLRWYYCGRGSGYYYNDYGNTYNTSRLDRALSDLVDAFKYADARSLQNLLPRNGEIDIMIDGDYAYSVAAEDYYDITADLLYSVYTTNFEILNVRRARGGEFWVSARHSYIDSWNREQTVHMTFTMEYVEGRFVIVQAGTGLNRLNPPSNY